jgi:phosphoribosylamine--glycine ligase
MAAEGDPFKGIIYPGVFVNKDDIQVFECNARFGDPETQVLLPRLAGPLGPWLLAAARGRLPTSPSALPTLPGAAVGVVLAAAGYPATPRRGDVIDGLTSAAETGALVFHAGTSVDDDGTVRTNGGRVLTVVARAADPRSAADAADAAAELVTFDGRQRRRDIGRVVAAAGVGA